MNVSYKFRLHYDTSQVAWRVAKVQVNATGRQHTVWRSKRYHDRAEAIKELDALRNA